MRTIYQSIIQYLDQQEGWRDDCCDDLPAPDFDMDEEQIHDMLSRWDELPYSLTEGSAR